jgi:hypothetical protein
MRTHVRPAKAGARPAKHRRPTEGAIHAQDRRILLLLVASAAAAASLLAGAPAAAVEPSYLIVNDFSHKCVDVAYGSTSNGAHVRQYDCYDGAPERWRLRLVDYYQGTAYVQVVNVHSGKCLDVPGGNRTAGVLLQQWDCWPGPVPTWTLVP